VIVERGLVRGTCIWEVLYVCALGSIFVCGVYITLLGVNRIMSLSPEILDYTRTLVSIISVAFAVYMGLRGNRKADSEEREARIRSETIMDEKMNDILRTAKDTRDSVKELQGDIKDHNGRLISVEESLKSLHHRVDTVESRLNGGA